MEKSKKLFYVLIAWGTIGQMAYADGLKNLSMGGDQMKVDSDGDILGLGKAIASGIIALVCGFICIYGLIRMIWDTWHKVGEYRNGRVESLGVALEPLATNGGLAVLTFGITVWCTSNALSWMG